MLSTVWLGNLKGLKGLSLVLFLSLTSASAFTQEAIEPQTSDQDAAQKQPLPVNVASDGSVSTVGEVLRLEETIRGNKEQPKVLSIVPWQLPLHQRIDRNENRWAPIKTSLKPMVRNKFLKEVNLLEGIQTSQSTVSNSPAN